MVELQVNRDAAVDYVAKRCGHQGDIGEAQGVLLMQDGAPAGAVVFHGFYKMAHGSMCEMSAAIDDAGVLTRGIVRAVLDYPFNQAKVVRLQSVTSAGNTKARKILRQLGFEEEGRLRRAWDGEADSVVYSQVPEECRWLGGN